jgi:hypothetical protein
MIATTIADTPRIAPAPAGAAALFTQPPAVKPASAAETDGRLLSLGFALMPNRLGYCGGHEQRELRDYYVAGEADAGLDRLLHKFEGAMPYLRLIALANGIPNPLDRRVAEAYWIGNDLLARTDLATFRRSLEERFRGRVSGKALDALLGKVPAGAHPHHNFHVFETYLRSGTLPAGLETLEQCRIGWGTVLSLTPQQATVLARPLVWEGHHLALGAPAARTLVRHLEGYTALPDLQVGDSVAFHWGWLAARLTPEQVTRLERETRRHLSLANQTL